MKIGAPQDEARGHKIDIVDFLKWGHGQAHRHSAFDKCKVGPHFTIITLCTEGSSQNDTFAKLEDWVPH